LKFPTSSPHSRFLPFTPGLKGAAQFTAAVSPSFALLYEPIPLTKYQFEECLGVEITLLEYRFYFESILSDISLNPIFSSESLILKDFDFRSVRDDFESIRNYKNIESVAELVTELQEIRLNIQIIPRRDLSFNSRMRRFRQEIYPRTKRMTFQLMYGVIESVPLIVLKINRKNFFTDAFRKVL
jgi:hypothetical protein